VPGPDEAPALSRTRGEHRVDQRPCRFGLGGKLARFCHVFSHSFWDPSPAKLGWRSSTADTGGSMAVFPTVFPAFTPPLKHFEDEGSTPLLVPERIVFQPTRPARARSLLGDRDRRRQPRRSCEDVPVVSCRTFTRLLHASAGVAVCTGDRFLLVLFPSLSLPIFSSQPYTPLSIFHQVAAARSGRVHLGHQRPVLFFFLAVQPLLPGEKIGRGRRLFIVAFIGPAVRERASLFVAHPAGDGRRSRELALSSPAWRPRSYYQFPRGAVGG